MTSRTAGKPASAKTRCTAQGPRVWAGLAIVAACAVVMNGHAASRDSAYPSKPIRLIVPMPPGGGTDVEGRPLAERLSRRVHQQIVVDNRGGANGNIGMELAARAPADGYTLIIAVVAPWAINQHVYKTPFDTVKDFAPIMHISGQTGVIVVHPATPITTVKELVALANSKAGALTYGSAGIAGFSHLSGALFALMANIRMTHVPYKGAGPALSDLVAGHIQVMFGGTVPSIPHIKSGRLRGIATTSLKRVAALADLPTVDESGVPGYETSSWTGIGAPAGTPAAIIDYLNQELAAVLQMPETKAQYAASGAEIVGSTPAQFRAHLKSELTKYGRVIKEAHITIDG